MGVVATALTAALLCGCAAVTAVGVKILYRRAELPERQVVRDIAYRAAAPGETHGDKLDLYRPEGTDWPVIVFVHGGNWDSGSKGLRAGGADVYANIGRFYAARGIGVAVIDYRLQPGVDWRTQVADVREAVRWVHAQVGSHGGRPDRIFLMGHSAGAQLASHVAFDTLALAGIRPRGVIAVSGAGLDLVDEQTYALGEDPRYYEKRFRGGDTTDAWRFYASPVEQVRHGLPPFLIGSGPDGRPTTSLRVKSAAPPFLILYAAGEKRALHRQSQLLAAALDSAGVPQRTVIVPGESHSRIVLTLSRPDRTAAPAILAFIESLR